MIIKNLYKNLLERRVLQVFGIYLGVSWAIIQFVDWLADRYLFSPHIAELFFLILLLIIPSILMFTYFHGRPGVDKWNIVEIIGIPINIVIGIIIIIFVFKNKDLGKIQTKEEFIYNDEKIVERNIPKSYFRKSITLFNFENLTNDTNYNYIQLGLPFLITNDLNQDMMIEIIEFDDYIKELKRNGISDGQNIPFSLKMEIASGEKSKYFLYGEIKIRDKQPFIHTYLYKSKNAKLINDRMYLLTDIWSVTDKISVDLKKDLKLPENYIEEQTDLPIAALTSTNIEAIKLIPSVIESAIINNNWGKAKIYIDSLLKIDRSFPVGWLFLFAYYNQKQDIVMMKETIQHMMTILHKYSLRDQFEIKRVYYLLNIDYNSALQLDLHRIKVFPEDIKAYKNAASDYDYLGNFDKEIEMYEKILKIDPNQTDIILKVADKYEEYDMPEKANKYYKKYEEIFPNDYNTLYRHAKYLRTQGDFAEAEEYYQKAIIFFPQKYELFISRAENEFHLGNFENTFKYVNKGISLCKTGKDRCDAYRKLRMFYKWTGQVKMAASYTDTVIKMYPKYEEPYAVISRTLLDMEYYALAGDIKKATEILDSIPKQLPGKRWGIFSNYLIPYYRVINNYKVINELEPGNLGTAMYNFTHGWLYEGKDMLDSALMYYTNFYNDNLGARERSINIYRIYRKKGDYKKAIRGYHDLLKYYPYNAEIHLELGQCYLARDNKNKAMESLKMASKIWENADSIYQPAKLARYLLNDIQQ